MPTFRSALLLLLGVSPFAAAQLDVSRARSARWLQTSLNSQSALASCLHADDCVAPLNGNASCLGGTCEVTCDAGFELSAGACRRRLDKRWHVIKCPVGQVNFYGHCLSTPRTLPTNKTCESDCQCSPLHQNAYSFCNAGTCSFVCRTNYVWNGRVCASDGSYCKKDQECVDGSPVSLLDGVCDTWTYPHQPKKHRCTAVCPKDFVLSSGCCTKKPCDCGDKKCLPVTDGYSKCKDKQCQYFCNSPTAKPSCNKQRCKCIDYNNNPNHCGPEDKFCPPPKGAYPGKHHPKRCCINGQCAIICPNGQPPITKHNGELYCGW